MKYTTILLAAFFINFIFQLTIENYTKNFSLIPSKIFEGEVYRLLTSIFLHADFSHLFFNSLALLMFGGVLERIIGSKTYILIFFLSGILGGIAYLLTSILLNELSIPALGASGAIYGIIGTLAILRPTTIVLVYFIPIPLLFLAFFWIILESFSTIFQFFGYKSSIASQAHLAGLLFGLLIGKSIKNNESRKAKIRYEF